MKRYEHRRHTVGESLHDLVVLILELLVVVEQSGVLLGELLVLGL